MGLAITQVDAFTNRPFAGNPAAVCILDAPREASWMQLVALEMNLSETAFLVKRGGAYDLRWFTPAVEIDLCGHATLASAHVLWQDGLLDLCETARFETRSGTLTAKNLGEWIELNFPLTAPRPATESEREQVQLALGLKVTTLGRSRFDYMAEIESEDALRNLRPDFGKIAQLDARGLIVTCGAARAEYDYVSRFFAPGAGIDEDPVTGSAHCSLAPYWKDRLGRDNLLAYQASPRGGYVRTRCEGDRVLLSGQAVTMMRAELVCESAKESAELYETRAQGR